MESTVTRSSGRVRKPTDAVTNPNNTASFELTSHRVAAEAAKAQWANAPTASHVASEQVDNQISPSTTSSTTTTNQPPSTTTMVEDSNDEDASGDKANHGNVNGEYIKDAQISVDLADSC